jgi:hypothetical protein
MKKAFFLLLIGLFSLITSAQIHYSDYFEEKILRIDIVRTGSSVSNNIIIQSFSTEPLWSGCRSKTVEPYDYGDYKLEITDSQSDKLLFLYTWSSLFAEYSYTETGKTEIKAFEETIRMPFPKKPVTIVFYQRSGDSRNWSIQHSLSFDPSHPPMDFRQVFTEAKGERIIGNSTPETSMDIALVAEGYTAEQFSKFKNDAQKTASYMMNCDPYTKHLSSINFWIVFLASEEEGVTDPSENATKKTAFACNFSTFGTDRYLMTENHFNLRDASSVVPYDHLIIIVNTSKYGGGGIYNFYATCPSDNTFSNFLVVHEAGHSIAGLADEYWTSDVSVINYYVPEYEPYEPNITTLADFDSKWKDMIETGTSIPTPIDFRDLKKVGVYEGGGYAEKGVYRPYPDCTMKSVKYNAFCPVCQRAIEKTLLHFSE